MNWLIFILAAFLCYALEAGLRTMLAVPGAQGVSPSFLLILAVYIGMLAPSRTVMWAFLACGLLTDLLGYYTTDATILGPGALGFVLGGLAVLPFRGLGFRESVITLGVLSFATGVFAHLAMLAILKLRGLGFLLGEPISLSADAALVQGFLHLLYTAVAAIPVGFILLRTTPLWSFPGKIRMDRYH